MFKKVRKVKSFEKLNNVDRVAVVGEIVTEARTRAMQNVAQEILASKLSFTTADSNAVNKLCGINDEVTAKMHELLAIDEDKRALDFIKSYAHLSSKHVVNILARVYTYLARKAMKDFSIEKVEIITNDFAMAIKTNDVDWLLKTIDDSWGYTLIAEYLYNKDTQKAA